MDVDATSKVCQHKLSVVQPENVGRLDITMADRSRVQKYEANDRRFEEWVEIKQRQVFRLYI